MPDAQHTRYAAMSAASQSVFMAVDQDVRYQFVTMECCSNFAWIVVVFCQQRCVHSTRGRAS